jgi:hypothetical protein
VTTPPAILSSWASDACAVESRTALRRPPGVPAPVTFDEVMDALMRLDSRKNHNPKPPFGGTPSGAIRATNV